MNCVAGQEDIQKYSSKLKGPKLQYSMEWEDMLFEYNTRHNKASNAKLDAISASFDAIHDDE